MAISICTSPKATVVARLTRRRRSGGGRSLRVGRYRSFTAAAAEEFSELDSVDMAAANTAATISPTTPTGR